MKERNDECKMLGLIENGMSYEKPRRVYSTSGTSPSILTMSGGA